MEIIEVFSPLFEPSLRPTLSKTQKRFILTAEFIRDRNGSSRISMTNNFPDLNGLRL
jgi:hypothetical protein